MAEPLTPADLDALRALDTPTVCNALEVVAPDRRGGGYSVEPFFCPRPELPPIVGYARTATIRAMHPSGRDSAGDTAARVVYYHYVGESTGDLPTVVVLEDLDAVPGYGAWWGEVNTNIHQGLGVAGVVTNGSIRDLDDCAAGFQMLAGMAGPSHAWVHVVEHGGPVTVHGMTVRHDDLIHADRHGAVIVPAEVARQIPTAAADIATAERRIIDAAQAPGFDADVLAELLEGSAGH